MQMPPIVSAQEWDAAREELLVEGEGADPRPRRAGRRAPADAVDGGREGVLLRGARRPASLLDLFDGRRQLIVYRFFFEPA